ncbi:serine/threonine-protein kinase H2 [Ctenopharyngodon idella]|uniref:serine/threonine-protein kinase H2 n=1 Tax=Ctenopharyngodon idella TaxID=7959 RepID=UPI00222F539A|nr:serine/threonine-protein kinase H2 [Ctenopharyngodon idella]
MGYLSADLFQPHLPLLLQQTVRRKMSVFIRVSREKQAIAVTKESLLQQTDCKVFIMGSSSGKVLPEPSKNGCFSLIDSVVNFKKQENNGEKCKEKQHAWLWRRRSDRRASQKGIPEGVKELVHLEERMKNPNAKFRAKFDPRVTARYDIKALIGCGSFSRVVRAEHRRSRQPFAIKLLEVKGREGHEACQAELGVLRRVNHSNVIRLAEVFETPHRVYLVLELATGGELLERMVARGTFRERDATKALKMVASGLCYLHALGVIHRDLKPENLLYYHPGQDSRLIITDFGLACWDSSFSTVDFEKSHQGKDWAVRTLCGTPEYLAPEMLARRPCSSAVDMWALGVITYIVLSGSLPFDQSSRPRLFRAILRGSYSFHGDPWKSVSTLAKSFIDGLLTLEPEHRMTAEEALKHPWLVSMAACSSNKNLHRSISRNLQRRASRASSRCPSSGSTPGSRISMRSGSRPVSGPRLGVSNKSQCLKIAT